MFETVEPTTRAASADSHIDKGKYYDDLLTVLSLLPGIKQKLLTIRHYLQHPGKRLKMKKQSPAFEQALVDRIELLLARVPKNAAEAQKFLRYSADNCHETMNATDAQNCEAKARSLDQPSRPRGRRAKGQVVSQYQDYEEEEARATSDAVQQAAGWSATNQSPYTAEQGDIRLRTLLSEESLSGVQSNHMSKADTTFGRSSTDSSFREVKNTRTAPPAVSLYDAQPTYQFVTYSRNPMYDRPDVYNDKPGNGIDVVQAIINNMLICRPDAVFGPVHMPAWLHSSVWHLEGPYTSSQHTKENQITSSQRARGSQQRVVRFNGKYMDGC